MRLVGSNAQANFAEGLDDVLDQDLQMGHTAGQKRLIVCATDA